MRGRYYVVPAGAFLGNGRRFQKAAFDRRIVLHSNGALPVAEMQLGQIEYQARQPSQILGILCKKSLFYWARGTAS